MAGGGVAAIEAVLALHALAAERVTIDLLAPGQDFVSRPSSVLSPFTGTPAPRLPLERLRELGVVRHRGMLGAVDVEGHAVATTDGGRIRYDRLIVATGARSVDGVPGATTFRGPLSAGVVEGALRGARERVLFTLPGDTGWTLPLYELALLTAHELPDGPELTVVTPEPRPLDVFGPIASEAIARLLDQAGIGFEANTVALAVAGGALATGDGRLIAADAVISLARLEGPHVAGLPADADGFIDVDVYGHVIGARDVFAAGDVTIGPLKQGGLATQQADAVAETIATEAGAHVGSAPAAACCAASCSPATRRCICAAISTTTVSSPASCAARPKGSRARSSGGRPASSPVAISRASWRPAARPADTLSDRPPRPVLA